MIHKTNVARILDKLNIAYQLLEYSVDEGDLSGVHAAKSLNIQARKLYKTLVLKGSHTPFLIAVIPSDVQLDLRKIATASGNKNCELMPIKDLKKVTGYVRGGCSPIGMIRKYPTYI